MLYTTNFLSLHLVQQLNILMDSEDAVWLVVDISKSPNGTCTVNNQTYNKYSLFYTIPKDLPVENEAYQVKKKKKKSFFEQWWEKTCSNWHILL